MVSHYTYAIGVLPLHMSFTEKIKLTTGLCKAGYNIRHQGQDYIQWAKKKKKSSGEDPTRNGEGNVGSVGGKHLPEAMENTERAPDFSLEKMGSYFKQRSDIHQAELYMSEG